MGSTPVSQGISDKKFVTNEIRSINWRNVVGATMASVALVCTPQDGLQETKSRLVAEVECYFQ